MTPVEQRSQRLRLFIPGPTEVAPEVLEDFSRPPIGHRTDEARQLIFRVTQKAKKLLNTDQTVLLSTSSATGLMEAAVRNLVQKTVLCAVNGAFSARWHKIAVANGKDATRLDFPLGRPVDPDRLRRALRERPVEAVTVVHNETSTGVISPLAEIADVLRDFPETLLLVDAVTSMGAVPISFDELGLDVCLASVQKALALPPGFALCAVSERALQRAATVQNRGYYFDFLLMKDYAERGQTPITPSLPHLYGLDHQLDRILEEGLERRYQRHLRMAALVQNWAQDRLALFADPSALSPTVTAVATGNKLAPQDILAFARQHGYLLASGYGELKDQTFRIAHMGELQEQDIRDLLSTLDRLF